MAKQSLHVDASLTATEQQAVVPPLEPEPYQAQPIRPARPRRHAKDNKSLKNLILCMKTMLRTRQSIIKSPTGSQTLTTIMCLKSAGRQIIKWHFLFNLNKLLVPQMMDKIWESVHNRLKINYSKTYVLRNIETNKTLVWMQDRQKALGLVILMKHKHG